MIGAHLVPTVFNFGMKSYCRHEELGKGGFATVYRVTDKRTGEEYALKVINKEKYLKPKSQEKLRTEISIQASLNHPNILRSLGHNEDIRFHYILLEYCPGRSVRDLIREKRRVPEKKSAQIIREVLIAVGYLHDNRIIHRDLKPENFLIGRDGKIKVADFGLSAKLDYDDEKKFTVCGTPNYLCPEILKSRGHGYEVDIWAIGVCTYLLLFGRQPFESIKTKLLYEHIKNGAYSFPSEPKLSSSAYDFIKSTLQINPVLRPSVQMLLEHPFIKQVEGMDEPIRPGLRPLYPERRQYMVHNVQHNNVECNIKKPTPIYEQKRNYIFHNRAADLLRNKNENFNKNIGNDARSHAPEQVPKYFVSRFCDDSKNGNLGYLLADGTVGLICKKNERWVMDPHENFIQHYRDVNTSIPEILETTSTKYPEVALIQKYSKSLKKITSMFELPVIPYDRSTPIRHVKYWLRNEQATLFRMDQKDVQVNFDDKTKIIYFVYIRKMLMVTTLKQRVEPVYTDIFKQAGHRYVEEERRFQILRDMLRELSSQ